ncbi:MAG: hypothetical protein FJZ01_09415 [Candidatus Sericytochromatia bacterium]|nr:hypothetical protein [Candidatus Tanganyikabacteria bacterium]
MAFRTGLFLPAALAAWATLLAAPAPAEMNGTLAGFEKWLEHGQPHGSFKQISDPGHAGVLYGGRVGNYETIVRVFTENGRIVSQKIEVELPSDKRDEIALSIIARFFREFTGIKRNEEELWRMVQGMRAIIYRTGRKEIGVDFRGARLSLQLDTQPNHDLVNPERTTWGTLFWRGQARKLPPRRKK